MSIINSIRSQLAPIHPQGYPFIGGFALASLILFWLWTPLGWIGTLATAWCAYFFRDPVRVTPLREGLVVAPADGRVSRVVNAVPPPELGLERAAAAAHLDLHERVRLPREPQPGVRAHRADGLSRRQVHQRRPRQGERGQRAQRASSSPPAGRASAWCRSRAWSRGGSCRSCSEGQAVARRRPHRHDPVRLARRCLSAGGRPGRWWPRARPRSPARPCWPISPRPTPAAATASADG